MKTIEIDTEKNEAVAFMVNKILLINGAFFKYRAQPKTTIVKFQCDQQNRLTVKIPAVGGYHVFAANMVGLHGMDISTLSIGNKQNTVVLRDTQVKGIDYANPTIIKHINDGMSKVFNQLTK